MGIPIDSIHEIELEQIAPDKPSQAREAFRAAWNVTKNASRKTRRFVASRGHTMMHAGKVITIAALIITAALFAQYIIAAGLMTVFSMSFISAWWVAILPAMLLLLSTIGFTQDAIMASKMKKMMEGLPMFNS
jgi:hypothetical protein